MPSRPSGAGSDLVYASRPRRVGTAKGLPGAQPSRRGRSPRSRVVAPGFPGNRLDVAPERHDHRRMDSGRSLMVVVAHPDDDAYGMAGTVALHADDPGFRYVLVHATDGAAGDIH